MLEVRPLEMTQRCVRTNSFAHTAAEADPTGGCYEMFTSASER